MGDVPRAAAAIRRGDDVNAVHDRDTLLLWAIRMEQGEIAKLLLQSPRADVNKRGVDYNDMGEQERTPLILAALMGQADIVARLLERGAHPNDRDRVDQQPLGKGDTALIKAAKRGHLDVVQTLFAHTKKLEVNLQGRGGKTALWHATNNEHLEMVRLLLGKGAKINLADSDGTTPLYATLMHKQHEVLDYLVANGADINWVNKAGLTLLMDAVGSAGNKKDRTAFRFIEKFLGYKPKLDLLPSKGEGAGQSALHLAARYGLPDVVGLLLDKGANVNLLSLWEKGAPLHNAALAKSADTVRLLLQRGAKTEIQDGSGFTPLMQAVIQHDPDTILALLEGGAVIDTRSTLNSMITPLVIAASNASPLDHQAYLQILRLLLDHGADINYQAGDGNTPLIAAAASSDTALAYDKARLLIERDARLDVANKRGETALMLATGTGNEKLVKRLLEQGADTRLKNAVGETVMSFAQRRGNKSVGSLLESRGVKPEQPAAKPKVTVGALLGSWQGSKEGLPQAVLKFVFRKDNTYEFVSRLTPEVLKQLPPGAMNPVIATHQGTYTVDQEALILYPTGSPPVGMSWQLAGGVLVLDGNTRLKKGP